MSLYIGHTSYTNTKNHDFSQFLYNIITICMVDVSIDEAALTANTLAASNC